MRKTPIALAAVGALLLTASPARAIVDGRTVQKADEYPAVGRLVVPYSGGNYLCTAILIRADVALTAKHCFDTHGFDPSKGPITLRFGSHLAAGGGQVREVRSGADVTYGKGFDLALIRFPAVTGIRPLPLVSKDDEKLYKKGTVGLAVGWGAMAGGRSATQLQEGALKIEDLVYSSAQTLSGHNYLMKASPYRGKIAGGDSGGPLIAEHVVNGAVTQTVVGVLSQGSKLDAAAYTKVGSTRPWITETMGRLPAMAPPQVPAPVPQPPAVTPPAPVTPPPPANRPPAISAVDPGDRAVARSTTPTLSVTATDPDGGVLQRSYRVTGPAVDISSGWVSGGWTVPAHRLDPGTAYEWTATVKDPGGLRAQRRSTFTVAMLPTAADVVATPSGNGYWQVDTYGGVFSFGDAPFLGSLPGLGVKVTNVIGMTRTPTGKGYWLVGRDGGVFAFGDAGFHGSMGGKPLNAPVVGMAPTRTGKGYWLTAADGGVFAFGDAGFHGSMGGRKLNAPVEAIAPTATGGGYWLTARDGGVFAFGDAAFHGSMGGRKLNAPVVDLDTTPDGKGYWLTAEDGGVFAFGAARFHGSMAGKKLNGRITGMSATADGGGYWLTGCDGGVFTFGNAAFHGSHATFQCRGVG